MIKKLIAIFYIGMVLTTTDTIISNPTTTPITNNENTRSQVEIQMEKIENEKKHKKLFYKQLLKDVIKSKDECSLVFSDDFFKSLVDEVAFEIILEKQTVSSQLAKDKEEKEVQHKYYTRDDYSKLLQTIEDAYAKKTTKTPKEYYLRSKYEILAIADVKKIIEKRDAPQDPIRILVPFEDLFTCLSLCHSLVGHKARDIMLKECQKNHINLTVHVINIFNEHCIECTTNKKRKKTTGLVVKPILSENFNSRGQVDLIDFQSLPDGEFKWLLVYQDHFSKFIQLRPIRAKSSVEVANALIDIFTIIGVPVILQSDNGREFRNSIMEALRDLWPEMQILHGRARHPQSQGSVERANADIKKMLATWMRENKSTKWTIGCKFIQFKKNHSFHTGMKCAPYKATFGIETPLGLQSTSIPIEKWSTLKTAEDLFAMLGLPFEKIDDDIDADDDQFDSSLVVETPQPTDLVVETVPVAETSQPTEEGDDYRTRANILLGIRENVRSNQKKQADRMKNGGKLHMSEVEIGDYVRLPVEDVDRGICDAGFLICRVIDIDYSFSLYELACQAGCFTIMFARNAFDKVDANLNISVRTDKSISSIREAVKELSVGGGQGMTKCNCTGKCYNGRCSCKKANLLCNSRCHGGNSNCINK